MAVSCQPSAVSCPQLQCARRPERQPGFKGAGSEIEAHHGNLKNSQLPFGERFRYWKVATANS
jgi:hypothetical protein